MKRILLFAVLICLADYVCAQTGIVLQGTVKDGNGKPLPFASVFLNQTTMGARSDESGGYVIRDIPPGWYEVIVSYLGYESQVHPVQLEEGKTLQFILKEKPGMLKEQVVRPDKDREFYLAMFKKVFIGEGAFAKECKLMNPDIVEFEPDIAREILRAKAGDFLEIRNEALGYNIRFLLQHFEYNPRSGYSMYYGNPLFLPMQPRNKVQRKRWEQNRREAYRGSTLQFFRSLIAGTQREDGYTMRRLKRVQKEKGVVVDAPPDSVMQIIKSPMFSRTVSFLSRQEWPADSVLQKRADGYVLRFPDLLYVVYSKEKEEQLYIQKYLRSNEKAGPQTSIMRLLEPEVRVDRNGNLEAPMNVIFENYWGWEKLAVMLPLDYRL